MESRSVGRAHVGGPFEMVTHDGKPFTDKDLLGKWSLVYFGFTNCPDICPEELDKMSAAVTELGAHPLLCMTDFYSTNTLCRQDVWSHRSANIHLSRPCTRHTPPNGPLRARLPPSPYRTGRRLRDDQGDVQGIPRIFLDTTRYQTG